MKDLLAKITSLELQGKHKDSLKKIAEEIKEYYTNKGRHSYSEVSTFIYMSKEEDFEYMIENLAIIEKYYKANKENDYAVKISKLIDHIQLELNREKHIKDEYYNKIISSISQADKSIKTYNDKIVSEFNEQYTEIKNRYNDLLKQQQRKLDNLYGDIISVLGIFSAVVVAFFGGISVLGSALNNISAVSKYKLILIVIIVGFIVFNIIFMLLYIISKLISKPIIPNCSTIICDKCTGKLSLNCLRHNYPVVFWYNLISVTLIFIDFCLFIIDKYNIITYKCKFKPIVDYSKVGLIGLECLIILSIILLIVFYIENKLKIIFSMKVKSVIKHKNETNKEQEEENLEPKELENNKLQ